MKARTPAEALALARAAPPALSVIDLLLGEHSGLPLVANLRREHAGAPVVLITSYFEPDLDEDARRAGAVACLRKPVTEMPPPLSTR